MLADKNYFYRLGWGRTAVNTSYTSPIWITHAWSYNGVLFIKTFTNITS